MWRPGLRINDNLSQASVSAKSAKERQSWTAGAKPVNAYFLACWFSPFFRRREPWWRLNWVDEYLANFQSGTPQTRQISVIHLLRSHRAALLLRELLTMNVLLQWVVIWAWSPSFSMVLMPCRIPLRDGHSLILSISRNSSTRLR